MKKSIRLLSVLMAMVMCFTVLSTGVSAAYTDYSRPAGYNALEHPYVSADQVGSALVDKLDAILAEKDMHGNIEVIGIKLGSYDLRSIDASVVTVRDLLDNSLWKTAKSMADLGDYENINFDAILTLPSRSAAGRSDLEIVYGALKFLYDNAERIGKLVDGKWDDGVVKYGLKLNDKLGDMHVRIKEIIFDALFKDAEPAPKCTATSTVDTMVNEYLYGMLIRNGSFLPSLESEMVKGGYMSAPGIANFNLNTISVYDLLRCVLRAALTDYVKPLLLDLLSGNDEILPLVTGLLEMNIPENDPETGEPFTSEGMVNYIVNDLLDLRNGTLSKYVTVTDTGIKLTTNFETLMNELITTAQGMMTGLASYDTVEKWNEEEVLGLTQPQTLAYLLRTLLTSMVDYAVIPLTMPVRQSNGTVTYEPVNGYAVATYMLINVMADKMPERNYLQMIENYKTNTGTPDKQLNPGSTGELVTNDAGTIISYEEPAAFTVLADYMYYYLNGKTTMNLPAGLSFDETLQYIVNWVIRQWGGLFRTNNLNLSATPNLQNMLVWKNLDILLWENVFDITWLPDSYVTLLKDSKGDYTGNVTRTLLLDNLLYTIVDLNLSKLNNLLKMFNKYEGRISGYPSTGEFDMDVIQFVLTLLKRILNGMFQSDNALFNNTQVKTLEDIVKAGEIGSTGKSNLRLIVENLSVLLSTKTTDPFDGAIKTFSERILRSVLPVVAESFTKKEETAQYFDVFPVNGETYTIEDLREIVRVNLQKVDLSEDMMTDENFTFFGSEDFSPLYKFYNYRTALREAKRFLEDYDWETERIADPDDELKAYTHTQEELNAVAYRVGYYLGKTALREADVTQLRNEINSAISSFGYGDYDDPQGENTKYTASDFTKKTWLAYTEALQFAQSINREFTLNGSGSLRQSKISAARQLLILAEKQLKFAQGIADYTYLDRLISLATAKLKAAAADATLYVADYLAELTAAYQAAIGVDRGYDGEDQDIIDEAALLLEEIVNSPIYQPQIAKVDGKKTVIDKIQGIIYGLAEKLSDYDAFIMPLGNGVIRYTNTKNGSGTGTEAYLLLNGQKVQTYTVVVFGDVDGDSRVDATDANIVLALSSKKLSLPGVYEFAADANDDGEITTLDAYYLRQSGLSKYTIDQRGTV